MWFTDLTAPDSSYVLPAAVALCTATQLKLHVSSASDIENAGAAGNGAAAAALLTIPLLAQLPQV